MGRRVADAGAAASAEAERATAGSRSLDSPDRRAPATLAGAMVERRHPPSSRRESASAPGRPRSAAEPPIPDAEAVRTAVVQAAAAVGVPIVAAYLFGSRAEGRAHRESDLDIAVLLPPTLAPSSRSRFELRLALTSALMAELRTNNVDLVLLNEAPPLLARRIVTDGRLVLCADEAAERAFRRDAQLLAADLEPFLRRTRAVKLRALRR